MAIFMLTTDNRQIDCFTLAHVRGVIILALCVLVKLNLYMYSSNCEALLLNCM